MVTVLCHANVKLWYVCCMTAISVKKKLNVDMIFDSGFQSFLQSMGQYIVLLVGVHLDAHLCSMLEHVRGDSFHCGIMKHVKYFG